MFQPLSHGRYQASNHQRVKGLPCYKSVFDTNIDLSNPATHKGNNALEGYNLLYNKLKAFWKYFSNNWIAVRFTGGGLIVFLLLTRFSLFNYSKLCQRSDSTNHYSSFPPQIPASKADAPLWCRCHWGKSCRAPLVSRRELHRELMMPCF